MMKPSSALLASVGIITVHSFKDVLVLPEPRIKKKWYSGGGGASTPGRSNCVKRAKRGKVVKTNA